MLESFGTVVAFIVFQINFFQFEFMKKKLKLC